MNTFITIAVICFLAFMVYSLIRYAKFIHHYPQQTEEKVNPVDDDPPAESGGDAKKD